MLDPVLAHHIATWRRDGLAPIRERWLAFAHPVGTRLDVRLPNGTMLAGQFAGLTVEGALRLRLADSSEHVIHAGDVFAI